MSIFDLPVNSKWFNRKAIILFLNKFDLFRKKLYTSPFSQHFPGFCGSEKNLYTAAQFNGRFLDIDRAQGREIYTHCTTATETTLQKEPMKSVEGMIVLQNLASGLEMGVIKVCYLPLSPQYSVLHISHQKQKHLTILGIISPNRKRKCIDVDTKQKRLKKGFVEEINQAVYELKCLPVRRSNYQN